MSRFGDSHGYCLLTRIIHEAWASESVAKVIRDSDAMKRSLWLSFTDDSQFLLKFIFSFASVGQTWNQRPSS